MSHGKRLTLEEARKQKKLDRFAKLNPSEGDKKAFDDLFTAMTGGKPKKPSKAKKT
jgi:hypothetical protein